MESHKNNKIIQQLTSTQRNGQPSTSSNKCFCRCFTPVKSVGVNWLPTGVGGPLLCIGDLLSDLGEKEEAEPAAADPFASQSTDSVASLPPVDLTKLFQENYSRLDEALAGTDHSWTGLTLKLCTALETANKVVQSTNSNVRLLSEKVGELDKVVKKGDSAVAAAKIIHLSLSQKAEPSGGN